MRPVEDPKRVLYEKWFFHGGNAVQTGLAVGGQGKEGIKRCRKYDAQRAMKAQKSGWSKIKGDQRQEKRRREAICNNEAHLAVWERASKRVQGTPLIWITWQPWLRDSVTEQHLVLPVLSTAATPMLPDPRSRSCTSICLIIVALLWLLSKWGRIVGWSEGGHRTHVLYLTVKKLTKIHLRVAIYHMKCGW